MTGELVGYGLSLLGVLFLVFFVPIALVVVVVTLLQRRGGSMTAPMEQWRRCNECKRRWWAVEGTDASRAKVLRRRRARRKARRRGKDTPEWARAQGWSRCPSCLSHDVRPSGQAEAQVSRGG